MPKPLGVKANLSFGQFRAGKVYEVDVEDGRMLSLLGVGYLSPVDEESEDDADDVRGSGDSVPPGVPVVGSPQPASEGLSDVDDQAEPAGGAAKRKAQGVRGRKASDSEDPDRL